MTPRSVHFVIPGRIGGKGRHRAAIRAGHIATYTPKQTQSEEGIVRHFAARAMRGLQLLQGPLLLHVQILRRPPQSWSKKKQQAAHWITGKPDLSNVLKLLEDSMNNTVFADDAQIASVQCTRAYSLLVPERIQIDVMELETAP